MADASSSTSPRGGFNVALMLSIIGIGLGGVALYLALTSDPFEARTSGSSPFIKSLDKYDMKSAKGTAKAEIDIRLNRDFRAGIEYESQFEDKRLKEKSETFKVEKEEVFKREPDKDPKSNRNKGTGELTILFVSFKENKEDKKEIIVMEKYTEPALWKRIYGFNSAEVAKTNKDLAAAMDAWK